MALFHASSVAIGDHGVLLLGPSGSGKSDVALRLIDAGAELVSDDQVEVSAEDGRLVARAPSTIAGLIEARGIGILALPHRSEAVVALAVELEPGVEPERVPKPRRWSIDGVSVPLYRLDPHAASIASVIRVTMRAGGPLDGEPGGSSAA